MRKYGVKSVAQFEMLFNANLTISGKKKTLDIFTVKI